MNIHPWYFATDSWGATATDSWRTTHQHETESVDIETVGIVAWFCKLCDWVQYADEWIRYGKAVKL